MRCLEQWNINVTSHILSNESTCTFAENIFSQLQFEFKLSIFNGICITGLVDNSNISGYFEYFQASQSGCLQQQCQYCIIATPAKHFLSVVRHCIFDMLWQMKEPFFLCQLSLHIYLTCDMFHAHGCFVIKKIIVSPWKVPITAVDNDVWLLNKPSFHN